MHPESHIVAALDDIVSYCDQRLGTPGFPDYPGALNGLQMANTGTVRKLGAAVDAGLAPFQRAAAAGVDFLIVHHGMFWDPPRPFTGVTLEKLKLLVESNLAVYSAHLPLDAHPDLGNNALLAARLDLPVRRMFFPFEGCDVGLIAGPAGSRSELRNRLEAHFARVTAIEFGSDAPAAIAIVTGGASSAIEALPAAGVDTLITGELKEHCFNLAQEMKLNLYACGHYATEVFGVCALAAELSRKFELPWEFIATDNPI
ncbi:MAG: Nif3-like dinuclear metal center hexameric protein [Opitutaceae bacterium]